MSASDAVDGSHPPASQCAKIRLESWSNGEDANFRLWLQGDIQSPEIDFRFTPRSRHSEAHA